MSDFNHFTGTGRPQMVDISDKDTTKREAKATARVKMQPETLDRIAAGSISKGDVLSVACIGGVLGAKHTSDIIPLCHRLTIDGAQVEFSVNSVLSVIDVFVTVKSTGQTGVEMEALTGAAVAALTIYDMCKGIDRDITIEHVYLLEKKGGKSGSYIRDRRQAVPANSEASVSRRTSTAGTGKGQPKASAQSTSVASSQSYSLPMQLQGASGGLQLGGPRLQVVRETAKKKSKLKAKPKSKPKAKTKSKAKSKTKSKPIGRLSTKAKPKAKAKPKSKSKPIAKALIKSAKPKLKPKLIAKLKTLLKLKARLKTKPKAKPKTKLKSKPKSGH